MKFPKTTALIVLICMSGWLCIASHSKAPENNPAQTSLTAQMTAASSPQTNATTTSPPTNTTPATLPTNSITQPSQTTSSPFWTKAKRNYDTAQKRYDENVLGQKGGYHLTLEDVMAGRVSETELQHRPFLYFRLWADRPLRVVPMAIFIFAQTLVLGYLIRDRLAVARQTIRRQFWRSLGQGFITIVVAFSFARPLFASEIGTPLAHLLIGLIELLLMTGLSTTVILIGETSLKRMGLADKFANHPKLNRLATAALGTIFVGLIVALPRIVMLPPVGIRLALLFCMLGSGGLLRSNLGTKQQPSENH
jgi:hypothetical protein